MQPDGIHALTPREAMHPSARKLRDIYNRRPGAPILHREFGFYCLEAWQAQGLPADADLAKEFHYEENGAFGVGELGWCEAAFCPRFEEKVLEDRGEHELVQDWAGRGVLCFKGRRSGFMPEYVTHPVTGPESWRENVKWRLALDAPGRFATLERRMAEAREAAGKGLMISQRLAGAAMYLRSLLGPEGWLTAFYDEPDLVRDMMETWLKLADGVTAKHQEHVTFDEIYFAEDICYNHGPLIGPDMVREFFFPYYRELLQGVRSRQIDRDRHLYLQIDTDGFAAPVIPLYMEIGMDVMSPFEVASGCDVVELGRRFDGLAITGGIDKRVLAQGPEAIDRMVERIIPAMRTRGGYIPTCDHGVPAEVSLANYRHYRKRCVELGG